MAETTVLKNNDSLNLITVWYRCQKRDSEVPMKDLKFKLVDADGKGDGWGDINDEPKKAEYKNKKILGIVCSPAAKNDRCNMVIFYNDDPRALNVQFLTDFDDKIDCDEEEGRVLIEPMNRRFMPHELVSITIYEEDHPNTDDGLSTSITHYSPPSQDEDPCMPELISERMPNKGTEVQPNYTYKLLSRSPVSPSADRLALWAEVNAAAEQYINSLQDQSCKVSSFNRSKDKKNGTHH
jgi:hypothetical protein